MSFCFVYCFLFQFAHSIFGLYKEYIQRNTHVLHKFAVVNNNAFFLCIFSLFSLFVFQFMFQFQLQFLFSLDISSEPFSILNVFYTCMHICGYMVFAYWNSRHFQFFFHCISFTKYSQSFIFHWSMLVYFFFLIPSVMLALFIAH